MESLQSGSSRAIVVCTDVAARGLDIPNVATVIHYDVARGVTTFIHRAGRTAVSEVFGIYTSKATKTKRTLPQHETPKKLCGYNNVPLAVSESQAVL
jgi:superfamily II DNA/RNA helicase